jgi:arginine decarboxylase
LNNIQSLHDKWTLDKARELYGIRDWGAGYFHISDKGEVCVRPSGRPDGPSASLMDIVRDITERGWSMPVLLRFEGILYSRIKVINESFAAAMAEYGYRGKFRGVYPIKVNQQQQVIEELSTYGREFHHGFEAGSKAELIAAMAFLDDPEALLICNGYKDEEFIDLGLYARKLGINCIFVVEMLREVPLIIERAKTLGVEPVIGVRMKLSASAGGHWKDSGGDRSVFGLNTFQVVQVVDMLRDAGMLNCLQLLHYHLGSQIPNIHDIRNAVTEAVRVYAGLVQEGAPMGMLDLGGGMAVDYDGSHTNCASSCNYTLDEYCRDIVEVVKGMLDRDKLPHPILITESGRATVAYYSALMFNILDVSRFAVTRRMPQLPAESHEFTRNLHEVASTLKVKNLQESFHDAIFYRDEIRQLFRHGRVTIRERALVEEMFWYTMQQIKDKISGMRYVPDDFENLETALADTYYGNLSVFQSLPDVWAIEQLFPVLPIHRLKEEPTRKGVIADITCDCDGKIDRFIDLHDIKRTLPLHDIEEGEEYYLGVFLVGAYQETLGDLHNLLGDTNVITVRISEEGKVEYVREIEGDSVEDVLSYVEYDAKDILSRFRSKAEKAVREDRISGNERKRILNFYQEGLRGYTYYESSAGS